MCLKSRFIFSIAGVLLFSASCVWAANPLGFGVGARPLALGNAYAGLSDDGAALFINPAGLAIIKNRALTSMYTQLEDDSAFTAIGGVQPDFLGGTIGFGYRNLATSNVQASAEMVSTFLQDFTFLFAKKMGENFSLGVDIRLISRGLSKDVSGFEGAQANGSALDLGIKFQPRSWLGLGLALRNLNGKLTKKTGVEEEITPNAIAGISINRKEELIVLFDITKSADEPLAQLHSGIEWKPKESFCLRLGADQTAKTASENYTHLTAGFGLIHWGMTFDYTFKRWSDPSQSTTQYFSLGYVGPKEIKPAPILPAISYPTPGPVVIRKVKRAHFRDIPADFWAKDEIELLATAGLISGFPDGTFRPKLKLTRESFEFLLATAKNLPPASVPYPNQPISRWQATEILKINTDITRPHDTLTRAEFAAFLSQTHFGQAAIKRLPLLK